MATMAERRKNTDDRIYRAAVVEFGKNGYANTTLSTIAKASGITPGLIVQNFGSKEELYRKITMNIIRRLNDEFSSYSKDWEERCTAIIEYVKRSLLTYPNAIDYLRFYISLMKSLDTPDDIIKDLYTVYDNSPVSQMISEGQKNGEVMEGDPYAIHSLFWFNMFEVICHCFMHKLDYPPNEWFLQVIRKK